MNSSSNAPWKGGRERSDRWRETRNEGFPPRVSDRTRRAFLLAILGALFALDFGPGLE